MKRPNIAAVTNGDQVNSEAKWLRSYAGQRRIKNYGGDYWGISRNRCTRISAEMIILLKQTKIIQFVGPKEFVVCQ